MEEIETSSLGSFLHVKIHFSSIHFGKKYQAAIWQHSLKDYSNIHDPSEGRGWKLNDEETPTIRWITGQPAPNVILSHARICQISDS